MPTFSVDSVFFQFFFTVFLSFGKPFPGHHIQRFLVDAMRGAVAFSVSMIALQTYSTRRLLRQ